MERKELRLLQMLPAAGLGVAWGPVKATPERRRWAHLKFLLHSRPPPSSAFLPPPPRSPPSLLVGSHDLANGTCDSALLCSALSQTFFSGCKKKKKKKLPLTEQRQSRSRCAAAGSRLSDLSEVIYQLSDLTGYKLPQKAALMKTPVVWAPEGR